MLRKIKEYLINRYYWLRLKVMQRFSSMEIDYDYDIDYDNPKEMEEWSRLSEDVLNKIDKEEDKENGL